jgi:peptidoglycan hydrolase-like protein with peptidoglycan-binding domain
MRKLILGTASVLALAIAGSALDYSADAENPAANATIAPELETSHTLPTAANLSRDDIRWAQLELRNMRLYNGSLDGVLGRQTKRAVAQFQTNKGINRR